MRGETFQEPWYKAKKDNAHGRIFSTIMWLRDQQPMASRQHWINFRMYSGFEAMGLRTGGRSYRQIMPNLDDRQKLSMNVARRCVDTVHARAVQNKPKPTFLTMGGEFKAQRTAKNIDRLAQGIFYHTKAYQVGSEVIHDAGTFGTGCAKIYEDWDGKPKFERVFIEEIIVDEADGLKRNPKVLFQYTPVDRLQLLEHPRYKKFAAQIKDAGLPDSENLIITKSQVTNQCGLAEAWRLPSNPYSDDGRHVICLNNVTLLDEKWEKNYHPFAFMRWSKRLVGFFGQGIPEQLSGIQWEINALLMKIQQQMKLAGPKVFVERGANIIEQHLNNEIWGIIEYSGTEPKFVVFQSVDPQQFEQLNLLRGAAFEEIGVSELSAHAEKPAGLNSGKALLTYNDIETSNFSVFGTEVEDFYMDLSDKGLDVARDSHMKPNNEGKKKAFVINYPTKRYGKKFLDQISWGDVALAKDEYLIQVFPTSMLPNTPWGKLQMVGDMIDRGMLQGDQAVSLLDFPDTEKVNSLITAALDDVDMMIEEMLDEGGSFSPEPFSNLDLAVKRMTSAVQRAKVAGYPEDRLELVRTYIAEAKAHIDEAAAKAQAGAPSMGAPAQLPGAQPPPPPVQGAPGMGA